MKTFDTIPYEAPAERGVAGGLMFTLKNTTMLIWPCDIINHRPRRGVL